MNKMYYYGAGALIVLVATYYVVAPTSHNSIESSIVETNMPELEKTFDKGAQLYGDNCSQCHGKALGGVVGNGPPFIIPTIILGIMVMLHSTELFHRVFKLIIGDLGICPKLNL